MKTWKHALATAALLFTSHVALAAAPLVEIIAMPHPPVKAALAPLRLWLAEQGKRLQIQEIDAESAQGVKRLQSVGLSGHIPVVILINGSYQQTRRDGSKLELLNFPNQPDTPPGARGTWLIDDVKTILHAIMAH